MSDKARDTPADGASTLRERLKRHAMGPKGLPSIGKELAYAVTDIRQKVVEEATYGRVVTPQPMDTGGIHGKAEEADKGDPLGRSTQLSPSFRDRCAAVAARDTGRDGPDRAPRGPHGPGREMD